MSYLSFMNSNVLPFIHISQILAIFFVEIRNLPNFMMNKIIRVDLVNLIT
jgi:hypothetical protein